MAIRFTQNSLPPELKVNLRIFRFKQFKNPRRPHPQSRASWVIQHPSRVSYLTLEHPSSPRPSLISPSSTNRLSLFSGFPPFFYRYQCRAGPFLALSQRGLNECRDRVPYFRLTVPSSLEGSAYMVMPLREVDRFHVSNLFNCFRNAGMKASCNS
jgi:hypothetical protein